MRLPEGLESLVQHGIIEEVLRPLMSGKEAQVYLVRAEGHECVAKIYKDAQHRSFKNKADYTEGRQVRNTRDQRAMNKRTAYGRARDEAAWKATEVDMIYRLTEAGVRVPEPYYFIDGVLVMELVRDSDGSPAKRLGELQFAREDAMLIFEVLLADVVRMLHAGVVHGDLSEFNVLMGADGPVIIDFPQSVNAAGNPNARKILLRDVDNLHRFVSRFARDWRHPPYAEEMWALYERGELRADTALTGTFARSTTRVRTDGVMDMIDSARRDEQHRRRNMGMPAQQWRSGGASHQRRDGSAANQPRRNENAGPPYQRRSDSGASPQQRRTEGGGSAGPRRDGPPQRDQRDARPNEQRRYDRPPQNGYPQKRNSEQRPQQREGTAPRADQRTSDPRDHRHRGSSHRGPRR